MSVGRYDQPTCKGQPTCEPSSATRGTGNAGWGAPHCFLGELSTAGPGRSALLFSGTQCSGNAFFQPALPAPALPNADSRIEQCPSEPSSAELCPLWAPRPHLRRRLCRGPGGTGCAAASSEGGPHPPCTPAIVVAASPTGASSLRLPKERQQHASRFGRGSLPRMLRARRHSEGHLKWCSSSHRDMGQTAKACGWLCVVMAPMTRW